MQISKLKYPCLRARDIEGQDLSMRRELGNFIEDLRKELIYTGIAVGFNHEETLRISQELDYFIMEYQLR